MSKNVQLIILHIAVAVLCFIGALVFFNNRMGMEKGSAVAELANPSYPVLEIGNDTSSYNLMAGQMCIRDRSKRWMRALKRAFNVPRLKSQIGEYGVLRFLSMTPAELFPPLCCGNCLLGGRQKLNVNTEQPVFVCCPYNTTATKSPFLLKMNIEIL